MDDQRLGTKGFDAQHNLKTRACITLRQTTTEEHYLNTSYRIGKLLGISEQDNRHKSAFHQVISIGDVLDITGCKDILFKHQTEIKAIINNKTYKNINHKLHINILKHVQDGDQEVNLKVNAKWTQNLLGDGIGTYFELKIIANDYLNEKTLQRTLSAIRKTIDSPDIIKDPQTTYKQIEIKSRCYWMDTKTTKYISTRKHKLALSFDDETRFWGEFTSQTTRGNNFFRAVARDLQENASAYVQRFGPPNHPQRIRQRDEPFIVNH